MDDNRDEYKIKFAEKFREAFNKWSSETPKPMRGMSHSQADFAEYLGIDPGAISNYLRGRTKPGPVTLHKIADKLGPWVLEIFEIPFQMPSDPTMRKIVEEMQGLNEDEMQEILTMVQFVQWRKASNLK